VIKQDIVGVNIGKRSGRIVVTLRFLNLN